MIIGLTGLAGSGKSEVAHALREVAQFQRVAFADPLKSMLAAVGFTDAQLYGDQKAEPIPEFGKTPREFMQTLGTEWGRNLIDQDIWLKLWRKKVEALGPSAEIVADDVRFANEADAIRALGGQVWRIHRPGLVAMGHASETQPINVDLVIENTAGLHELRQAALMAWANGS